MDFKQQTGEIAHEKSRTCLKEGNFKEQTEFLLIVATPPQKKTTAISK